MRNGIQGEGKALKGALVNPEKSAGLGRGRMPSPPGERIMTNYTFSSEDSTLLLEHKAFPNFNDSLKQLLAFGKWGIQEQQSRITWRHTQCARRIISGVVSAVDHRPSAFNHKVGRY